MLQPGAPIRRHPTAESSRRDRKGSHGARCGDGPVGIVSEPAGLSTVPPTERQLEVLRAIDRSIREEGYPPTLRELCGQLGVLSTNAVASIIEPLIKKG